MTDTSIVIALAETTLQDIAKQAHSLSAGLQNVAPSLKADAPNKTVQYLSEAADAYAAFAVQCKKLADKSPAEQKEHVQEFVNSAVDLDKELREKFQIADKFRFVRERLIALQISVKESMKTLVKDVDRDREVIAEGEVVVYVYLFNAQGLTLQSWLKMLTPTIFYEHSVNRPIYIEKAHVEGFIRRKPNKIQHGIITVRIMKDAISKAEGTENLKDVYDHPLIKVKEGALKFDRMIVFTHNEIDYTVNENGQLVRKLP